MSIRIVIREELKALYPSLVREPPPTLPQLPKTDPTAIIIGRDTEKRPVGIPLRQRLEHMLIVGATGSGKSSLLLHFMRQAIRNEEGLLFLDPHGNHPDSVYRALIAWLDRPVHIIDLNSSRVVGFNPLACPDDTDPSVIVGNVMATLAVGWEGESFTQKPTIERNLSAIIATLVELKLTLCETDFLLDREDALGLRQFAIQNVKDPHTRSVLKMMHELSQDGRRKREYEQEVIGSINRLARLLRPPTIRHMIGQTDNCLDIREVMDAGGIILANLSGGTKAYDSETDLLGRLLTRTVLFHAKRRQNTRPFNVVLDEAHRFLSLDIPVLLAEIRKYGVSLVAAIQWLAQAESVDETILSALLNGPNCKICFRLRDAEEAEKLARTIVPLDLERPVDALIRPIVVGNYRTKFGNESDSTQQSKSKTIAVTNGETHGSSETAGETVGASYSTSFSEGTTDSTSENHSSSEGSNSSHGEAATEVYIPTLDPGDPFLSRTTKGTNSATGTSASSSAGSSHATGRTMTETTSESLSYARSKSSTTSYASTHAKTHGEGETNGTGNSKGYSEGLEPIFARLPTAVHSIQNELYRAGLMLRSLPTAVGFLNYVGSGGPVSTLFQVPPVFVPAVPVDRFTVLLDTMLEKMGAIPKEVAMQIIAAREREIAAWRPQPTPAPSPRKRQAW